MMRKSIQKNLHQILLISNLRLLLKADPSVNARLHEMRLSTAEGLPLKDLCDSDLIQDDRIQFYMNFQCLYEI
jgi:hypothetical protein